MATITEMADATKPSPSVNSPATHQRPVAEAEVAPKPHTVAKPPSSDLRGRSADRLSNVVERTADMSVELLKSLETGELAAIDAVGTFAISIEDGLTEQVNSTSAVAKTFVIAIEGSLSEQVTGTSAVVKKLVVAIPDALTEQVTGTSAVVKKLVIALPDALTEQVTSTSAVAKKLVIAMEDAVTDEITATTTGAKKITVSGFEMADRFVRLEHDVLRGLIQGAARPLVVQNGTLRVGDNLVAGSAFGKVRALIDDTGKRIKEAGPSTPVVVTGLSEVLIAGEIFEVVETERGARPVQVHRPVHPPVILRLIGPRRSWRRASAFAR